MKKKNNERNTTRWSFRCAIKCNKIERFSYQVPVTGPFLREVFSFNKISQYLHSKLLMLLMLRKFKDMKRK